jgi:hypothetical protein
MSASTTTTSAAREINRLHDEIVRRTTESKNALIGALEMSWRAGQLLLAEKERVRRTMGGAWLLWLEQCFHGTPRTAQKYMRLAQTVDDVSTLRGMSLRQTYFRLGIATEPKSRAECVQAHQLPPYIRLANKLLVALRPCVKAVPTMPEQGEAFRRDLRPLYDQLRRIFEKGSPSNAPENLSRTVFSDKEEA